MNLWPLRCQRSVLPLNYTPKLLTANNPLSNYLSLGISNFIGKNIKQEPKKYLILYLKKAASFLFIDFNSSEPNYYNPLHYMPVVLLGITSLIGIILSNKKSIKLNYLILIFFLYVITFSFFAILPRYKLAIIPLQIIFTNILINYINKRIS